MPIAITAIAAVLVLIYGPLTGLAGGDGVREIPDPTHRSAAINTVRCDRPRRIPLLGAHLLSHPAGQLTDRSARAIGLLGSDKTVLGRRPTRDERNRLNLSFADLGGANLLGADLRAARLRGANLRGAKMIGADLSGANLLGADLTDASLAGANLTDAKLGGALPGSNSRAADLTRADLRGANLTEVHLDDRQPSQTGRHSDDAEARG